MLPSTGASYNCLDFSLFLFSFGSAVWDSHASTSGRHMPSETDVCGVTGHPGPLIQIKEEK